MSDFERLREDGPAAFAEVRAAGEEAARAVEAAFGRAGEGVVRSLSRAAADGRVTLDELARAALAAVSALARTDAGRRGLASAAEGALGVFRGARADGGPVTAGGAYLVGERGPEVFRPASAGTVEPAGVPAAVTMNVTVQGGPETLLRSEAQLAAALARATAVGMRRW